MLEIMICPDCGFRMHRPTAIRRVSTPQVLGAWYWAVFFHCPNPGCAFFVARSDFQRRNGRYQRGIPMRIGRPGEYDKDGYRTKRPFGCYSPDEVTNIINHVAKNFQAPYSARIPKDADRITVIGDFGGEE